MEKQQSLVNSSDRLLFLIDGFPRNKDNYDGWNKQMDKVARVHGVLFFNISDEVATDRCLKRGAGGSGRSDDNVESIKKRQVELVLRFHLKFFPPLLFTVKGGIVMIQPGLLLIYCLNISFCLGSFF